MDTPVLTPAPAGMPGAPVPAARPLRHALARATDLAEGIVYWGILAFGLSFPVLAALYALVKY